MIEAGTRLAHYDIKSPLGKGGMGEVYRANDQKLGRDVAIKILPKDFAQDADRLARFQREAKLLASLNHPNIAAIHGLEYANDTHFLVLELVEGETLADHLTRGPIPVDESLKLAAQIAEALQAAHEKGVIHRDLKPANIKLTHDGTVKVLDFGLAKAGDIEPSDANVLSNSPTLRTLASSPGIILGTAAYMSPEQAKGRPVDRRTDVWAFGCVLYEMITGKRAFVGDDVSDTLASVLRAEPDWSALPTATPATLRTLIQRCLAKDRAQRIADVSVAKFLLTEPSLSVPALPQSQSRLKSTLLIATVALLSIVAGGAIVWRLRPQSTAPAIVRFRIDLPEGQTFNSASRSNLAVSPDGTQIVYAANGRLYYRSISDIEARPIPGSESNEAQVSWPIFSPDAQSIAYFTEGTVKRIPVDGGAPVSIGTSSGPLGMSWTRDGIVLAQSDGSVVRLWPDGRPPERLLTVKENEFPWGPQILPGGENVLLTIGARQFPLQWDQAQIVMQSLKTGKRTTLINGGSDARYLSTGHLLYAVSGTIWAVPFDLQRQRVPDRGVAVIQGVRRSNNASSNSAVSQLAVSDTGTLVYVPGPSTISFSARALVQTDRKGTRKSLPIPVGPYHHPRVSRDGKYVAVGIDDGREAYISIYDLSAVSSLRRLTFGGHNRFPVWSGDSRFIAFQSDREGDSAIFIQRADGSTQPERLTKPEAGVAHIPESWSHDGRTLLFSAKNKDEYFLWSLSLASKQIVPFGNVRSIEYIGATFSPDDRWVAYAWSDIVTPNRGTPNRGIYLQPFPTTGELHQVPREFRDFHPAWGATSAELFYIPTAVRLSVVNVQTQPSVTFSKPATLPIAATRDAASPDVREYDVTPDGMSFVSTVPNEDPGGVGAFSSVQMHVVVNWFEDLRQRVPVK